MAAANQKATCQSRIPEDQVSCT